MANIGEYGDSLRICWTGVRGAVDAYDPAASLGGERLGETIHLKYIIDNPIPPIRVRGIGATNTAGTGYITAVTSDMLAYSAPGDSYGAPVTIADGETVVLVSADGMATVRAERVSSDDLGGTMTLTLTPSHGGALGMGNVGNSDAVSGVSNYRGLMIHNPGAGAATDVKVWVKPLLATGVVSDSDQLPDPFSLLDPGIVTTTANAFDDWPPFGFVQIIKADGTLREICFYTTRDSTSLRFNAANKVGLLGSTHSAGAADDTLYLVPGIRIAKETPSSGAIQAVADENTEPAAVTWDSGITSATGLSEASIAADGELGLRVHRETPVSSSPIAAQESSIGIEWISGGVTYTSTLSETYAVQRTAYAQYDIYVGEDVAPDLDADPVSTFNTFPKDYGITPPGSGTTDFNLTIRQQNAYGLKSRNTYYRTITIDAAGDEVSAGLGQPQSVTVSNTAGGHARVQATYYPDHDAAPADTWRMYITTTGVDPDPDTDAAIDVTMIRWGAIRPAFHLIYNTPAYAYGTDLRVLVRTYKTVGTVESTNTTATALSIATAPEPQFLDRVMMTWGTVRRAVFAPDATVSDSVITDAGNNIHVDVTPGVAEFWADTVLVWRVLYDSLRPDRTYIYIPSEFALYNYTHSGASTDDIIQWVANAGNPYLRIHVGLTGSKIWRAAITLYSPFRIQADSWNATATMPNVHPAEALTAYPDQTVFSVYDAASAQWIPYLSVTDTGAILTAIPINQTLTQAQIEAL